MPKYTLYWHEPLHWPVPFIVVGWCSQATIITSYYMNFLITHSLTRWSRVLLQKLNCSKLVKKFPTFYGTRRFITAVTSACHLSLSWANSIQSIPPNHNSGISILILSSHLRLGVPNGLFPLCFPTKTLHTTLLSPIRATCPTHLISGNKYLLLNYKIRTNIKTLILTTKTPRRSKNSKALNIADGGELSVSSYGHLILDKASNTYWTSSWIFNIVSILFLWPQNLGPYTKQTQGHPSTHIGS